MSSIWYFCFLCRYQCLTFDTIRTRRYTQVYIFRHVGLLLASIWLTNAIKRKRKKKKQQIAEASISKRFQFRNVCIWFSRRSRARARLRTYFVFISFVFIIGQQINNNKFELSVCVTQTEVYIGNNQKWIFISSIIWHSAFRIRESFINLFYRWSARLGFGSARIRSIYKF